MRLDAMSCWIPQSDTLRRFPLLSLPESDAIERFVMTFRFIAQLTDTFRPLPAARTHIHCTLDLAAACVRSTARLHIILFLFGHGLAHAMTFP